MRLVLLCLFCLSVFGQESCSFTNEQGITFDLGGMTRFDDVDFMYLEEKSNLLAYFVNICSNTRENCSPPSPICEQSISTPLPQIMFQSWAEGTPTWITYQPDPSSDGITLSYNNTSCDIPGISYINILCDLSVEVGIIDTAEFISSSCSLNVNMRSKYGCGYHQNVSLTCADTTAPGTIACDEISSSDLQCQSGDLTVSCENTQNVTKYTFYMDSNYSYYGTSDSGVYGGSYTLALDEIFEIDKDGNQIPGSYVSLSSISWNISNPEILQHDDSDCTQETVFTVQNSDGPNWSRLFLNNHISMDDSDSTLKFDLIIDDYVWQSDSSVSLVCSFLYNQVGNPVLFTYDNSTTVSCGNSYFTISSIAFGYKNLSDPGTPQILSASIRRGAKLEVAYSRFTGSLVHDPTIGIQLPLPNAPIPPCGSHTCNFDDFVLTTEIDAGIRWTFSLPDGSNSYAIVLYSLKEVEANTPSLEEVSYSAIYFMNLDWANSIPKSSILEDGSAQTEFSLSTGSSDRWSSVTVLVAVSMKERMTHFSVTIKIEDYVWVSNELSSSIQIELDIGGEGSISYSFSTVVVGEAYIQLDTFGSAESSTIGRQITGASIFYSDSANMLIPHFDGSFTGRLLFGLNTTNDPLVTNYALVSVSGVATAVQDNEKTDPWWIWLLICSGSLFIVFLIVFIIAFLAHKRHRSIYQSL